ncbi:MAG: ATP-binding protein [Pseudomonadota bacterium]
MKEAIFPAVGTIAAGAVGGALGLDLVWVLGIAAVGACAGALAARYPQAIGASEGAGVASDAPNSSTDEPLKTAHGHPFALVTAALESLPIGVLAIGPEQTILHANELMRWIFGLPDQPGYPMETLRSTRLLEAITTVTKTGAPEAFEMVLTRGADVFLNVYVRPVDPVQNEGISLIVAVEDVTQARQANDVHRDFVANASHELKTPLAVISGLIETLQGPARDDPVGTERFLGLLGAQTRRMTGLIDDLMSLNRIEMNERVLPSAPQELTAVVREAVDGLRPVADASDVELVLQELPRSINVMADREELSQLFANLIDNAIKYGGIGKAVRIKWRRSEDDGQIGVAIEDEGPGIPREHLPRLTERFYRVDIGRSREKGGTGLGLAICKHIVNRHRGRLEIESTIDEGSRFTVWLPYRVSDGVPEKGAPLPFDAVPGVTVSKPA